MEKRTWKITLSDGTELENLTLSGNNFISETEITEDDFSGKLSKVTIEGTNEEGEKITEEHENMELIQIVHYTNGYYFILRDIPENEQEKIQLQADIEYLAMMCDVDLEV